MYDTQISKNNIEIEIVIVAILHASLLYHHCNIQMTII